MLQTNTNLAWQLAMTVKKTEKILCIFRHCFFHDK